VPATPESTPRIEPKGGIAAAPVLRFPEDTPGQAARLVESTQPEACRPESPQKSPRSLRPFEPARWKAAANPRPVQHPLQPPRAREGFLDLPKGVPQVWASGPGRMRSSWGILVSRFLHPLSPTPPLPTTRRASFEAACGSCRACRGHGRASKSFAGDARPHPLGKRCAFSTVAWTRFFEVQSGARVHKLPQAPSPGLLLRWLDDAAQSYIPKWLDGPPTPSARACLH